ncbi:ADC synthase [Limtongia smithiae]|uniref:ADC synthase n=1 Tax=Limtongia smithiae TaxID=1125753 RepID=UPI0034CF28CF
MHRFRVLLVDSYDSFTFNLVALLRGVDAIVDVVSSEHLAHASEEVLAALLATFDAILIGPGPGSPCLAHDVHGIPRLFTAAERLEHPPVIVGVCLGFQWLLHRHGHAVSTLPRPRHGLVSVLDLTAEGRNDLYRGIEGDIECVRYHSLYVEYDSADEEFSPLAWTRDVDELGRKVLMAARHRTKPYWAVQYHPESICSHYGRETFANIFSLATEHINERRRLIPALSSASEDLLRTYLDTYEHTRRLHPRSIAVPRPTRTLLQLPLTLTADVTTLCDALLSGSFTLLHSAAPPGEWSYIGIRSAHSRRFTYTLYDTFVRCYIGDKLSTIPVSGIHEAWEVIKSQAAVDITTVSPGDTPPAVLLSDGPTFHGGLIGYLTYEAGVACGLADVDLTREEPSGVPDLNFEFYERSVAVHAGSGRVLVHTIERDETAARAWFKDMEMVFTTAKDKGRAHSKVFTNVTLPDADAYLRNIATAQEYLAQGDSYELCLTAQTVITESPASPHTDWMFYKHMTSLNPAPYACFYTTPEVTLLGMSPERFLRWDDDARTCELRPIKGTVKNAPDVTRAMAEARLRTPKERAENLMIVDLIRHDLAQLCASVEVSSLMGIEEYKTVYQLVSVIMGRGMYPGITGADVLRATLPPGSMTGAPKRRSVELLQSLESHSPRGVYSGVCGYIDVLGHGDFSVIIRSAYAVPILTDSDRGSGGGREWRIGAGGAITALSVGSEEVDEMVVKLESALRGFLRDVATP